VSSAGGIDQDTIYDLDSGGDWQCGARMLSDDYEIAGRGSVRLMYSPLALFGSLARDEASGG